ncbi:hypothetical protein KBB41_03605 [Candidatus Curtissbacteria bacterium]|nr:hypothetical protein [Candidatus Curtissbacteria bacterium]
MKYIIYTIITIATAIFLFGLITKTVARAEQNECAKWAKQAQEYPKFYYLNWQKSQCGIK